MSKQYLIRLVNDISPRYVVDLNATGTYTLSKAKVFSDSEAKKARSELAVKYPKGVFEIFEKRTHKQALISMLGYAGLCASDKIAPTFEECVKFRPSINFLEREGVDASEITQAEIDEAWLDFMELEDE